jgi:hypothetical protein
MGSRKRVATYLGRELGWVGVGNGGERVVRSLPARGASKLILLACAFQPSWIIQHLAYKSL